MQQHSYDAQQATYGGQQCPYCGKHGGASQPDNKLYFALAGYAVGCGFFALFVPIPILDVILGILGIVFAALAIKNGVKGLAISALVISILGIISAITFTIDFFTGGFATEWALSAQMLLIR